MKPPENTILIQNVDLWPAPDAPLQRGAAIRVEDGRIAAAGPGADNGSGPAVEGGGCLCMPGLIQGHVHLCQTLFRGIGEDLALLPWLRRYIWPMEAHHDPSSIRASALLSVAEMLRTGTTAFMSMETIHHTGTACEAVAESGIMGILGHCLMDDTGGYPPLAVPIDDSLAQLDALRHAWSGHDRIRIGVAPRFALSCAPDNLRAAAGYARAHGLMLHTHSSEQRDEVDLVRERTGMENIQYLHSVGLTGPDVGLAHCVHTNDRERAVMQETDTRVLHCPSANLKLGSGVAPIPEYLALGLAVSLGADGAPCNNRLDGFLEMREAGLIQKPRIGPEQFPAADVVDIATRLGARALNWEDEMGTLEVGKRANLILVSRDSLHVVPSDDPATNLVYSNLGSDVRLTMVNGEILYRDGELLTIDEEKLKAEAREERIKLEKRAGLRG